MYKLCVFAGTYDGRALVDRLAGRGLSITVCTATEYGEVLLGERDDVCVRSGRMDRAAMEAFLTENGFDTVVDATHPYAAEVTKNIKAACETTGREYLRLERASTSDANDGIFLENAEACAKYLAETTGNILLTTGSKDLKTYAALSERIYARVLPMEASLKACAEAGIPAKQIIAMQGPFSEEMNIATMRAVNAKYMVTKDTGNIGGYTEKIRAAQAAGAAAIILGRPVSVEGMSGDAVLEHLEMKFNLPKARKHVVLAGIGMGSETTRTVGLINAIREADCLIGAKRMLEGFASEGKRTHEAVVSKDIAAFIREDEGHNYTVLLSGDTGFYSGATKLVEQLSEMEVKVLPGVGSLSYFCAQLKRPWQNIRAISLHGRESDLIREVRAHESVFAILGKNGVREALDRLIQSGLGDAQVSIGERLGYPEERISIGTAQEMIDGTYDDLSVIIIDAPKGAAAVVTHGLPDEVFERAEVPMTKAEVRSVSLSKLQLKRNSIIWDIGAGTGSVTMECARMSGEGIVYAIEKKASALELIERNRAKMGLNNVTIIPGSAPEALEDLPAPTHAFIGGTSGSMEKVIDIVLSKNPEARIVANAVTLETVAELTRICKRFDESNIVCMNVASPRVVAGYHLMTGQNPVYIFTMQDHLKGE